MPELRHLIRKAVPADARTIAEINKTCWQRAYAGILDAELLAARSVDTIAARQSAYLANRDGADITLVAEQAGEIAGYVTGGPQRDDALAGQGYDGELKAIYVRPDLQRSGAGSELIAGLSAWFLDHGYRGFALWTFERNGPARAFYRAHRGRLLDETRTEPRFGDAVEVAYGWADARAALASPAVRHEI